MVRVSNEDWELFAQRGATEEAFAKDVQSYRDEGLSEDKIQRKIDIQIGMMRNPEGVTPYMKVANDPNLTTDQKVFKLNAIKNNEDYNNSVENQNMLLGAEGLRKAEAFEKAHPIASDLIRPWLEAYKSDSQELAMMGKRTPIGYLKRGTMGGLGGFSIGSIPFSMGAKTVLNPFTANMIKGAASFAAPTAGYMASEVMNNEKTGQELAQETAKNAALGAAMSGVGSVASAPVRAATMNQLAKPIENRLALKALKYNRNVSDEGIKKAARNLLQKDLSQKTLGSRVKAGLYETPASLVGGAADALAFGNIDYGLDKLQNNTHGTYAEYIKEALPLTAFAGLGVGAKVAEPYLKSLAKNIELNANKSNATSRRLAETKNALNLGDSTSYNVKRFQDADKLLKKLQGNGYNQLTREDIINIKKANKVSPEEADRLFKYWKTGEMPKPKAKASSKKTSKKQKQEQTSFDELNQELKEQNKEPDFTEQIFGYKKNKPSENMSKSKEKVSEGTNRPTEDKTLDNGHPTSSNDVEKVSDFLNKGIVSEGLENIKISAKDLADSCTFLKDYVSKNPDVNITFSKNKPYNGSYDFYTKTIDVCVDKYNKETVLHEYQHAIDLENLLKNKNNADFVILYNSVIEIESKLQKYYNVPRNKSILDRYEALLKEGNVTEETISNHFGEVEQKIIETFLDDYYEPYYNHILERRARISQTTGEPLDGLQKEIADLKLYKPNEWEELIQRSNEYAEGTTKEVYRGNVFDNSWGSEQRIGKSNNLKKDYKPEYISKRPNISDKYLNGIWANAYPEFKKIIPRVGSEKFLMSRFNSYGKNVKLIQEFYNKTVKTIKNSNEAHAAKQAMLKQLNDVAKKYADKHNFKFEINNKKADKNKKLFDIKIKPDKLNTQDKFNVVRDSKATEKILIETGILEDKQALNRLKQQHKSGDGIYFQQYTMHDTDGINLARDYSQERSKKVGWWGRKVKEGLRKKARTVDIVSANKLRRIKAENIKNTLDYLEKNFGVKTSAAPKRGNWKPINKALLANAMWGGTSKKWYELLSKDEAAIRAAFKDKKQADYWVDLHKRTRNTDYYVPEEIYNVLFDGRGEKLTEYWSRYKDTFGNNTKELTGVVLDIANNFFKRRVLGTPSFVLNNRMNQLLIAARSDSPADYLKSLVEARNIKDYDLPAEVLENSIAEAVEQSTKRNVYTNNTNVDNLINLFGGHMIDLKTARGWKKLPAAVADVAIGLPNAAYNKIADGLLNLNTKMEVFERKQIFAQQLNKVKRDLVEKTGQQMVTTEEAIKHVHEHPELKETIIRRIEDTLGDYNNFNKFERNVLKRAIPFYSWHRTMARHLVHLIKENPARCAMIYAELAKAADDDSSLHKILVDAHILSDKPRNTDLKNYQKGAFRTPLKDERSGKQLLINKKRQIPYYTPKEWFEGREDIGSIAPIFRVPAEAIKGKKFFNDSEITNKRYVRVQNPNYKERQKQPYKYFDTKTKKYLDELPASTRLGYIGKEALRDAYPLVYNNAINLEGVFGGYRNLDEKGKYLEYDKSYDASFGGFRHGDIVYKNYSVKHGYKKPIKRFASNNTSEETKLLNRLGLTLQPKQDLSKTEKEALKDRIKKYKEKHKKKS